MKFKVVDKNDNPIDGAKITATMGNLRMEEITDNNGECHILFGYYLAVKELKEWVNNKTP